MRVAAKVARLCFLIATLCLVACSSGSGVGSPPGAQPGSGVTERSGGGATAATGPSLGKGIWVGPGVLVENLTVFAVYAKEPRDIGDFTTIEKAMAAGTAEIREVGGDGPQAIRGGEEMQQQQQRGGGGARVDTLVIENRDKLPILILAGTMVKGGKQDRQIGEDVVVPSGKTLDISAFCVEQGRWNGTREGKDTGGKFVPQRVLATNKVRAAGQHDKDQSEVWKEVASANSAHDKKSASGTFMASVDDAELVKRRAALSTAARAVLAGATDQAHLVGLAYAVDGEVRGVRWFAGPKLFALFQDTLLETAAFEAITAQAEAKAAGREIQAVAAKEEYVVQFTDDLMAAPETSREEDGEQARSLKKAKGGYSSELRYDKKGAPESAGSASSPAASPAPPITVDLIKK